MKFLNKRKVKEFKKVQKRMRAYDRPLSYLPQWERERWSDEILSDKVRKKLKELIYTDPRLVYCDSRDLEIFVNEYRHLRDYGFGGAGQKAKPPDNEQNEYIEEDFMPESFSAKLEEGKLLKKIKRLRKERLSTPETLRIIDNEGGLKRYYPPAPISIAWFDLNNPTPPRFSPKKLQEWIRKIQVFLKMTLTPLQRKIYNLKNGFIDRGYYPDEIKDFSEIAKILRRSSSTIKTLYYRAIEKLKRRPKFIELKAKYCKELGKKL